MMDAGPKQHGAGARRGRPRAAEAGAVEARILTAASALFLEQGFARTSLDQIAERAQAGKATLYARYRSKEALLMAVVRRSVEHVIGSTTPIDPAAPLETRLATVAASIVRETLRPEVVALMRVIVAEAAHLPALAGHANRMGREGGVHRVAQAMLGGDADAAAFEAVLPVAGRFVDLMFVPLQMRALLGEDLEILHRDADANIRFAIQVLKAMDDLPPSARNAVRTGDEAEQP
jgi:AcrR family transcriptional regulator